MGNLKRINAFLLAPFFLFACDSQSDHRQAREPSKPITKQQTRLADSDVTLEKTQLGHKAEAPKRNLTPQEIAQKSFPSVVLIVTKDANGRTLGKGSGFFVKEKIIATNLHVIQGASSAYAKVVGQHAKFEILGTVGIDKETDLALLQIEYGGGEEIPSLELGNSGQVKIGDEVYAVGNPLGLEGTFSKGIISAIRLKDSITIFQLTAPISPGSSGGPVLHSKGEVIAVSFAGAIKGQNLNFAIPSYYLKQLLSKRTEVEPLPKSVQPYGRNTLDKGPPLETGYSKSVNGYWRINYRGGGYLVIEIQDHIAFVAADYPSGINVNKKIMRNIRNEDGRWFAEYYHYDPFGRLSHSFNTLLEVRDNRLVVYIPKRLQQKHGWRPSFYFVKTDKPSQRSRKVYKWTDKEGKLHITDYPPPKTK